MNYRNATLQAAKSVSAADTLEIPIRTKKPISRINLRYQITQADTGMSGHPALDITKIELVDGSDVLHSLNGMENQGLAIYSRKVPTMIHGAWSSGSSVMSAYGIDFGRHLWDRELALLPGNFENPVLNISYALTNCSASASAAVIEVDADLFDERLISPIGFLSAKEHRSYTCGVADSYEYVELPRDRVLRQILIRPYQKGYEPWYQVDKARLTEDNEARTLFDVDLEMYYRMNKGKMQAVEELIMGVVGTGERFFYTTPTDYWAAMTAIDESQVGNIYLGAVARGGKFDIRASGGAQLRGIVRGYLPNQCFQFPFGIQDDLDDWYDVTRLESAQLRLQANTGGVSGICAVVTEQLRRY